MQAEEKNKKYETAKTPFERRFTMKARSQKLRGAEKKKKPAIPASLKINKDLSLLTNGLNDKPVAKVVEEVKQELIVIEEQK